MRKVGIWALSLVTVIWAWVESRHIGQESIATIQQPAGLAGESITVRVYERTLPHGPETPAESVHTVRGVVALASATSEHSLPAEEVHNLFRRAWIRFPV